MRDINVALVAITSFAAYIAIYSALEGCIPTKKAVVCVELSGQGTDAGVQDGGSK